MAGGEDILTVIGGGLAGAEAAWQAARLGVPVDLYEMRPQRSTPAHQTGQLAELVCSNSLRGTGLTSAPGLLKEEMSLLGSITMAAAAAHQVPAGSALAVDRDGFAAYVTAALANEPLIRIIRTEVQTLPATGVTIVATGPLTSTALAQSVADFTGREALAFYDAAAPIVTYDSLDHDYIFRASRYGKGAADYLNCPLDEAQYDALWSALVAAARVERPAFERDRIFEGCLPIEDIARRGRDTLRYGPLKPVGLTDPRTGERPFAVVQLRQDNAAGSLYNMVGFQTSLKWGEQQRVLRLIPGLGDAEFVRLGVMHRNTFISSPQILQPTLQTKARPDLLFAGQVTGVEGYIESASGGMVAGVNGARLVRGQAPLIWPADTAMGALCHYITATDPAHFQPMNINFGLLPPPDRKLRGKARRREWQARRALHSLLEFARTHNLPAAPLSPGEEGADGHVR